MKKLYHGASDFPFRERHLQCIWYDADYRPSQLAALTGESVVVKNPGSWNHGAGPDFLDATLAVQPDNRILKGDVEIHVDPFDWVRHGHSGDPAYKNLVAHVYYSSKAAGAPFQMDPKILQIPLEPALTGDSSFSFESIDITDYPHAACKQPAPCIQKFVTLPGRDAGLLLDAAGRVRILEKSDRMRLDAGKNADEQVLYRGIMSALGYSRNRKPMIRLAEVIPLAELRDRSGGDILCTYALLLGAAGLLPRKAEAEWDGATRSFLRSLWDYWWQNESSLADRSMQRSSWSRGATRPQNQPLRRLMAAADIFTNDIPLVTRFSPVADETPRTFIDRIMTDLVSAGAGSYWSRRLSMGGRPTQKNSALIGAGRAASILVNVVVPFATGTDRVPADALDSLLELLPDEKGNHLVDRASLQLLGSDHNPALYRTTVRQQGLIQIFMDYCLNNRADCAFCGLLKAIDQVQEPVKR